MYPALELCVDTEDVVGRVVVCLVLVTSVDRVVVRWLLLVVYDPDDPRLLVVCPALVVCVDTDVAGTVVA